MAVGWLEVARILVAEGYCPNDLGAHLDKRGFCGRCGFRFWIDDQQQLMWSPGERGMVLVRAGVCPGVHVDLVHLDLDGWCPVCECHYRIVDDPAVVADRLGDQS
jgi:hypothetical protein